MILKIFRFVKSRVLGATDEEVKNFAKHLKQLAQQFGLEHVPVILTEPEHCSTCRKLTNVLMQPHNICGECWQERLAATIERDQKISVG